MAALDFAQLGGLMKTTYETKDGYVKAVPEEFSFQKTYKYNSKVSYEPGRSFKFPVQVRRSGGGTWGGSDAGIVSLNTPIPGLVVQAEVKPSVWGQAYHMPYTVISQLGNFKSQSPELKKAFASGTGMYVTEATSVAAFNLEIACIHGQSLVGLGVVSSASRSGNTLTITLTPATYNGIIWRYIDRWNVDVYDTTGATQRNATSTFQVRGWSDANTTVDVYSTNTTELDAVVATDAIHLTGSISNAMAGAHVCLNNSTGSYLGLSATTYPQWASNQHDCSEGPLTLKHLAQGLIETRRGGMMGDMNLFCNHYTAQDIADQPGAQIQLDNNPKMYGNSIRKIVVAGRTINIIPHDLYLPGYAHLIPERNCVVRFGPQDISLKDPVTGEYFSTISQSLGVEGKTWFHQGMVIRNPASCCLFYDITNQSA